MMIKLTPNKLFLVILLLFSISKIDSQNKILNNSRLRVGNGSESSINSAGNMQQPFYYNGTEYRKLTFSTYPLDIRWGVGGDGANNWNINGALVENPVLAEQTFDYSGFTVTKVATGDGYGKIITTGNVTLNSQLFQVENSYELLQPEGYIAIKVKITNKSDTKASNVRLWVGTRDDYVGGTDQPTKQRGNLDSEGFTKISNQADQAKAIKIYTAEEAIIFFSNSNRAFSSISGCCSFSYAANQNPVSSSIEATNDGSYALYVRFNDLQPNTSDELTWYYAAGTLSEIDEITKRVANAAMGSFNGVTYNSAQYGATVPIDGTGYYILVPKGSPAPTASQIESGVDYNGVSVIASGSSPMLADEEHVFTIQDLEDSTEYDFYFISKHPNGGSDTYSEIVNETLGTLEGLPVVNDINPKKAGYGDTMVITGSNFTTTSSVTVGGVNAEFRIIDANTIEVIVPNGVSDLFTKVINESGGGSVEKEGNGETDADCTTGWSNAWQTLYISETSNLRTVTLKLENLNEVNSYDLSLELYGLDNDPLSANPYIKFNNVITVSDLVTINPNTTGSEVTFTFNGNVSLKANTNYYVVLKESNSNPLRTGDEGISFKCDGNTDGGSGNIFGTLYYKFTTSPFTSISNSPTQINISVNTVQENNAIDQIVGALSAVDPETGDTHTFQLVSGTGDTDNASFEISGANLLAKERFDFETKSSYSIRVRVTDSDGNTFDKIITITITDLVIEDSDGDGVPDDEDAFPLDPNESADLDGDGIGDNSDDDIDGDGVPNDEDAFPYDPTEDTDTDGDGIGDNADTDIDGDGVPNDEDAFPLDSNESADLDGDGIGDNSDDDIDGDGVPNDEDVFPLDPTEDTDTDGDGIGDNTDTDDDNDGILDLDDEFPKHANPLIMAAEAFTPNGDGINDAWVIPGINNYPNSVVKIYNRSGQEVFAARGYKNDWEGYYKSNSEKLAPGSYLYVIDLGNGSALIQGWIFINY